jgi:hypothetical protein
MLHDTTPALFASTTHLAVVQNPVNDDWVALIGAIGGERFETLARRYYVGLSHFRKQRARPALPGQIEIEAEGKQQALLGMLEVWERRKESSEDEQSAAEGPRASTGRTRPAWLPSGPARFLSMYGSVSTRPPMTARP